MHDGSVYTIDHEPWLRAFAQKYGDADCEVVRERFRDAVAEHWAKRTKPWKGLTIGWDEDPYSEDAGAADENHAALAEDVMYASLRGPLMAIAMAALDDEDEDAPSVVSLQDDGAVVYTGTEAAAYDSVEEALSDAEDEG